MDEVDLEGLQHLCEAVTGGLWWWRSEGSLRRWLNGAFLIPDPSMSNIPLATHSHQAPSGASLHPHSPHLPPLPPLFRPSWPPAFTRLGLPLPLLHHCFFLSEKAVDVLRRCTEICGLRTVAQGAHHVLGIKTASAITSRRQSISHTDNTSR